MKISQIAWRNIRRNLRRSILSMSAIGVAAMILLFMFSMIEGMKVDMKENLFTYTTGEIRVRNAAFDETADLNPLSLSVEGTAALAEKIEALQGIEAVSPRITFGTAIYRDGKNFKALAMGVDMERERLYQPLENALVDGRLPENGEKEVLIAAGLAKSLDLKVGDKFTIYTRTRNRGTNARTLRVTGIAVFELSQMNGQFFLAPLDQIQKLLKMNDQSLEILVRLDKTVSEKTVKENLTTLLSGNGRSDLAVTLWSEIDTAYNFITMAEKMYTIIGLLFFLLGSTVIINTTMMVIFERMREIGTLSAMGMTGNQLIKLFFIEALLISMIGSGVGVILGMGLTFPFTITGINFGEAMEGTDWEISTVLTPIITIKYTVLIYIFSVVTASVSSFFPSIKASKIDPVTALRG